MTTWATLYREILAETGRPAGDDSRVKLAIVAAMDKLRGRRYFYSEAPFSFATAASVASYGEPTSGFPRELISFAGDLTLQVLQDAANLVILPRLSLDELQDLRSLQSGVTAQPEAWAWSGRKIELYPTPDAAHNVTGVAVVAPGTVIKRYDTGSSSFKFYVPGTTAFVAGNEIADAYPVPPLQVNAWFAEGYELLKAYASYFLYVQVMHVKDERGGALLQRALECEEELIARTNALTAPRFIEPMELW